MIKVIKKQLKDKEYIEAIIKISKIKECWKISNGQEYKDKLICCKISKPTFNTHTCFGDNRTGHRELIKFLRDELYLKK